MCNNYNNKEKLICGRSSYILCWLPGLGGRSTTGGDCMAKMLPTTIFMMLTLMYPQFFITHGNSGFSMDI